MLRSDAQQATERAEQVSVDDQWVVAAQRGDMRAFERLYRAHSSRVYGLCLRMTRRADVAEDCVQLTFVRAWRNLKSFEGRSAFSSWLHRIAVNEVLSHLRNHGTRSESDEEAVHARESADGDESLDAMDIVDVERAIARLPDGARHAVVLQALYGYSHEEAADMLGVAVGTCKAQVHRGRRMLRKHLGLPEVEA